MFELKHRDGMARIGEFTTGHGTLETPNIMPVINPNVKLITPKELKEKFGSQVLITNSYVIFKSPDLRERALDSGLHKLLDFDGTVMTDSGTFQAHVYGDIDVEPDSILDFQMQMGSDVSTILDMFTEPTDGRQIVEKKVNMTVERARQAVDRYGESGRHIALPIQGGVFPDLREDCARQLSELEGSFYPIGGVVPLLENYRYKDLVDIILASKRGLGPAGPIHLFGAGHPMVYPLAVLLGCDLFDSSSYAKYARRGDMMYPDGTRRITNIQHLGCLCPVCQSHTAHELRELENEERVKKIAEHNLWVSYNEIERIKQAIMEGSLWELVETRARVHPYILDALRGLSKGWKTMDIYEPRSRRGALFYTGASTLHRPVVERLCNWILESYEPPVEGPTVLFDVPPDKKPYHRYLTNELNMLLPEYPVNLMISTPFGPVPLEMDEVYPVAQSIFPHKGTHGYHDIGGATDMIQWDGEETLGSLSKGSGMELHEMKVRTVSDYQFSSGAGNVLTDGVLEFNTNRMGSIKNVILDGDHVLSMRHYDGLFTLKPDGAVRLHKELAPPLSRVKVTDDSATYNREGKNVFAGFIIDAWDHILPGDEVLIVDKDDSLVAIARSTMNSIEMDHFKKGIAARTRDGFSSHRKFNHQDEI